MVAARRRRAGVRRLCRRRQLPCAARRRRPRRRRPPGCSPRSSSGSRRPTRARSRAAGGSWRWPRCSRSRAVVAPRSSRPPTRSTWPSCAGYPRSPGYMLAIVGDPGPGRPRRRWPPASGWPWRSRCSSVACLVVVQFLVVGPAGGWAGARRPASASSSRAAVVVTSATMAAALTLLGVIEARRQPMALVLLAGTVLLTGGRGLGTSALLAGAPSRSTSARFLVARRPVAAGRSPR